MVCVAVRVGTSRVNDAGKTLIRRRKRRGISYRPERRPSYCRLELEKRGVGQCKRPRSPHGPEPLLIGIAATSDPAKLVGRSLHRPQQPVYGRASEKTHSWQAATHMRSALHSPRVMIPSAFGGADVRTFTACHNGCVDTIASRRGVALVAS